MKKIFPLLVIFFFTLISCNPDDDFKNPEKQIKGTWILKQVVQQKNNATVVLDRSNTEFNFDGATVSIKKDTPLHDLGNYNYSLLLENYFNQDLQEPKGKVLTIDGIRYMFEITASGNSINLTNFSDGRFFYYLERK
ncbi:MAG: hypothetical protein ACK4M4_00170 [Flavobacterium sp.]